MTQPSSKPAFNPRPRDLSRDEFVARFGEVYEHSPWIAEAAHDRGLTAKEDSPVGLADTMAQILAEAGRHAKIALIRAHPDLAGRAAIAGDLTAPSASEQRGAGLDRCTPEEYRRFQELNDAYKQKFGFPFILAVAGKTRHDILTAFENRLGNSPDDEFRTALAEINKIALTRLERLAAR